MKIPFFKLNGLILLISSVLFLLFTKNLFLQFISTGILIIIFYNLLILSIIKIRNLKYPFSIIAITDGEPVPFQKTEFFFDSNNSIITLPGITNGLYLEFFENNERVLKESVTVEKTDNKRYKFSFMFKKHGEYKLKNLILYVRDIFGFNEIRLNIQFQQDIIVYPYYSDEIKIPFFMDKGGELAIQKIAKENSTDFFENRKYFPGDDPRRINWKVFAHFQELQIREVEKIPPKIGELFVIFAPHSNNNYEYEYISSIFLSTVDYLINNNFSIKVLSSSGKDIKYIKKHEDKELKNIINNSTGKLEHITIPKDSSPIIFCSFGEYKDIINNPDIKECYSAVSFFENDFLKNTFVDSLTKINISDNLFLELNYRFSEKRKQKVNNQQLLEIHNISEIKKIDMNVFKANNEVFRKR